MSTHVIIEGQEIRILTRMVFIFLTLGQKVFNQPPFLVIGSQ